MKKASKAAEWADQVFMLIPENDWVSVADLMKQTKLHDRQVREGVAYIRDKFPDLGQALVSGPNGYQFTLDETEVAKFRTMRMKVAMTQLRRTYTSVKPFLAQVATKREADFVERQFERLVEDVGTLV
jgi:transcriptional antiterminator